MTATCPICKDPVSATAKFCRHCRAPLPPPRPPVCPLRRRSRLVAVMALAMTAIILCSFCILAALSARKALQSRGGSDSVESLPPTRQEVGEAEATTPTPILPLPLPLPPAPPAVPPGQREIMLADGVTHPIGEFSRRTADICVGGCGSFSGTLELKDLRITTTGFVLDVVVQISEVQGDIYLFQNDLEGIVLEINGLQFTPVGSKSSLPSHPQVGQVSGYLAFDGQIPLVDPTAPQIYRVVLAVKNQLQPLEGWLK